MAALIKITCDKCSKEKEYSLSGRLYGKPLDSSFDKGWRLYDSMCLCTSCAKDYSKIQKDTKDKRKKDFLK